MPIFFVDKSSRKVAAVHCGRMGLEKKILKKLVKIFENTGTARREILVAIGPSISNSHYLVDPFCYREFIRKIKLFERYEYQNKIERLQKYYNYSQKDLNPLDLKKYAYLQLINEDILSKNIDISKECTFSLSKEFYSYRRSKTSLRQWNFISG